MPTINQIDLVNDIKGGILTSLGTYTYPDGTITPAFASLPDAAFGYNYPPSSVNVDGIECVVIRPTMNASPRLDRDSWVKADWGVFLKQWSADTLIEDVADLLLCTLTESGYRFGAFVDQPPSEDLGLIRTISLNVIDTYLLGVF